MNRFSLFPRYAFPAAAVFFALSAISCASTAKKNDKMEMPPQIREGKFFKTSLSNGIPVVIKESRTDNSQTSFSIIIDGGSSCQSEETAGIDSLIFSTLRLSVPETASYKLFDECTADYSLLNFSCGKKTFEASLSDFMSQFMSKSLSADFFASAADDANSKVTDVHLIPEHFVQKIRSQIFSGMPYAVSPFPTEKSIQTITYADADRRFAGMKDSSHIKIAAVGDFDEKSAARLILNLEKSFGNLERIPNTSFGKSAASEVKNRTEKETPLPAIKNGIQKISRDNFITDETVLDQFEAKDLNRSLAVGCFLSPNYSDSDYAAFALATMVYDNLLRHELLGIHNMAFSAGCGILPGKIQLGLISIFETDNTESAVQEAKNATAVFPFPPDLDRVLSQYKRSYINQIVQPLHSSLSEMQMLVTSWIYFDDAESYTRRPALVNAVSASEVCAAFEKYIKSAPVEWVIIE